MLDIDKRGRNEEYSIMGMKNIELRWPIKVGDEERHIVIKRQAGWIWDTLVLELDGDKIFTSCVGGFASAKGSHQFRVNDNQFSLSWKWSILTGDPEYVILRSRDQLIHSHGKYKEGDEQSRGRRATGLSTILIVLGFVIAAVATNPSEAQFKEHIRSEIRSETGTFANLLLGRVTTEIIMAATNRTDFYVFSLYKTQIDSTCEVRLGAFGRIWGPFKL